MRPITTTHNQTRTPETTTSTLLGWKASDFCIGYDYGVPATRKNPAAAEMGTVALVALVGLPAFTHVPDERVVS